MNLTIPDTVIAGACSLVAGALVWGIRTLVNQGTDYFIQSKLLQTEALNLVREISQALHIQKSLDKVQKAITRLGSRAYTCEQCGGWDGPEQDRPSHLRPCRCSDPPPAPITQREPRERKSVA